jgi:hypothetical protein
VRWYWYLIGPAIIAGYHAIAFAINLLLGAAVVSPPRLSMGLVVELVLLGGLWEEPGWSGYALPKLQERFANQPNGPLIAALTLGAFRAIWHLPLFLYGHLFWFDILIFSFAFQLIIAWVFNRSGGSVPAVILLHFMSNLLGSGMNPVFDGAARTTYYALFMALASLAALVIVWRTRLTLRAARP